ncbi:AtpZ/AtpI family protein [Aquamicrobium sp. LC103]|uniref:AtpZ/AtpI family protein n=1 Tax=Aquamicrobium sp. LC103 TaxID=1120658 RepID=UPI00063E86D4|nr:AtpZ/AtpI family protein [Aquamicrobium sp. LC103]TKT81095.1 ATP F0F1 synthase subunit I [Aquamicrobium sp. LC103]
MAGTNGPDETGKTGSGKSAEGNLRDEDLVRRKRELEAALAARRPKTDEGQDKSGTGSMAGFGQAMKLSSEFIAGVAVGAGLGWFIDQVAGTSPWGLIIFLLLGFVAGVLNVLRSAGLVAEPGPKAEESRKAHPEKK